MKIACVLDVEGVLLPPGVDFALILKEVLKRLRPGLAWWIEEAVSTFDKYDDARWLTEQLYYRVKGYQVGSTPFYVLLIAAALGLPEDSIRKAAELLVDLCAREGLLVDIARLKSCCEVYLTSSAYHVFVCEVARRLGIELSRVRALGLVDTTCPERIVETLTRIGTPAELLLSADLVYYVAKNVVEHGYSLRHGDLLKQCLRALRNDTLSSYLVQKLCDQVNIAGSRVKAALVERLRREGYIVVFVGDSIVDVEAAQKASLSIAINTTCTMLLHVATLTVVLQDYARLVDVLECLISEGLSSLLERAGELGVRMYTRSEVSRLTAVVEQMCREAREHAKARVSSLLERFYEYFLCNTSA